MHSNKHVIADGQIFLWIVVIYGVIISSLLVAMAATLVWYGVAVLVQWVQFL